MKTIIKRKGLAAGKVALIGIILTFFPLGNYAQDKRVLKGKEIIFVVEELDEETWRAYDSTFIYMDPSPVSLLFLGERPPSTVTLYGGVLLLESALKSFFARKIKDQNIQVTNEDILIFHIVCNPFPQGLLPQLYDVIFVYPKTLTLTGEELEALRYLFFLTLHVTCDDEAVLRIGYADFCWSFNMSTWLKK